jgi:predicted component of type VI protein secretion system
MFELVVHSGKQQGKRLLLPIGKEVVVGREEGCQLLLNSSLVSRRHCQLQHVAEGIWVRDLGSQNGTFVNDVALAEPTLLKDCDLLRIGAAVFEVQATVVAPQPAKRKSAKGDPLSDDDIASWLTDEIPASSSDTTIIPGKKTVSVSPVAAATAAAASVAPSTPAPPSKKFKSVKDEAADIIRRHWAAKQKPPATGDAGGPTV